MKQFDVHNHSDNENELLMKREARKNAIAIIRTLTAPLILHSISIKLLNYKKIFKK